MLLAEWACPEKSIWLSKLVTTSTYCCEQLSFKDKTLQRKAQMSIFQQTFDWSTLSCLQFYECRCSETIHTFNIKHHISGLNFERDGENVYMSKLYLTEMWDIITLMYCTSQFFNKPVASMWLVVGNRKLRTETPYPLSDHLNHFYKKINKVSSHKNWYGLLQLPENGMWTSSEKVGTCLLLTTKIYFAITVWIKLFITHVIIKILSKVIVFLMGIGHTFIDYYLYMHITLAILCKDHFRICCISTWVVTDENIDKQKAFIYQI